MPFLIFREQTLDGFAVIANYDIGVHQFYIDVVERRFFGGQRKEKCPTSEKNLEVSTRERRYQAHMVAGKPSLSAGPFQERGNLRRTEEQTSEIKSLKRKPYTVFCMKTK